MSARRAFTLMELMVAVLLGAVITLMIAGALRNAIRSWETVQQNVSENYNRRSVLDLIKRQASSLFFKRDMDEITQSNRFAPRNNRANRANRDNRFRNQDNRQNDRMRNFRGQGNENEQGSVMSVELPHGTYFLRGAPQELSLLSTVSFLSDFPGQVAVRYYVVQGDPEEGQSADELASSRRIDDVPTEDDLDDLAPDPDYVPEALEGDLYLYVEEKNLFLSASNQMTGNIGSDSLEDDALDGEAALGGGEGDGAGYAEAASTQTMKLMGPLRKFTISYRKPASRQANELDDDEDWSETWDVDVNGQYPSAIEFILVYEQPGVTDDIATEDLPGIRMVIPVYDARNLARGGRVEPF